MPLARPRFRIAEFYLSLALSFALASTAHAQLGDRAPLTGPGAPTPEITPGILENVTGAIVTVDPDSVSCEQEANFEDVAGGMPPGANYDAPLWSGGKLFGERFLGQTIGYSAEFDVISGTPSNPLQIIAGAAGQSLNVFQYVTNVLTGLGALGYPDIDAIGEGSIAILFPLAQHKIALDIVGGNSGTATVSFYRLDGTLIDSISITNLGEFRYGFATGDLTNAISGILIQTTDPSGVGIDNVCHEGAVVPARALSWGTLKTRYR
jgi:hypothetical protein